MRLLLIVVACLIVYGSLYPFAFSTEGFNSAGFKALLTTWDVATRRGDILGNVALFVPFGLIGQVALPPRDSSLTRFILLALVGFALAAGVQVLQMFTPDRDPLLADAVWNMVGLGIGAAPAFVPAVRELLADQRFGSQLLVPLLLLACWFGSLLVPFVPSIDLQLWKDGLKPLLLHPAFVRDDFVRDLPAWLAAACLGAVVVGERWLPVKLALVAAATLALKVVIIHNTVGLTDVAAAGAAVVLFAALARVPRRELAVVGLLLLSHLYLGLTPLETRVDQPSFGWIPFGASLHGSMANNAAVIAYKMFSAGALVWLLVRVGAGYVAAGIVGVLVAGIVEVGQLFVGDGTPEITDPLLALAAPFVIAAISSRVPAPARQAPPQRPQAIDDDFDEPPFDEPFEAPPAAVARPVAAAEPARHAWLWPAIRLAVGVVVIAGSAGAVLHLPGIPYNVRELFWHNGSVLDLVLFAVAVLSIGAGTAAVARRLALARRPYLVLPAAAFVAATLTHALLYVSVTTESLRDIRGGINFLVNLTKYKVLGDDVAATLITLDVRQWLDPVMNVIEPIVRFAALYMPLPMTVAIFAAALLQLERFPAIVGRARIGFLAYCLGIFALSALPWYLLCKFIAFDVSSTDNLNELIARQGFFGTGGGGYLYLLLLAVGIAGALGLSAARRPTVGRIVLAVVAGVVSLPLGWWLLNLGLEPQVHKYGKVFSGADFLLGPDRQNKLSHTVLMLRWFVVQGGLLAVLAYGASLLPRRDLPSGTV